MTLTREAMIHHHAFRAMGCQMAAWVLAESEIEARAGSSTLSFRCGRGRTGSADSNPRVSYAP